MKPMPRARRVEVSQKCAINGELIGIALRVRKPVRMPIVGPTPSMETACATVEAGRERAYRGLLTVRSNEAAMATSLEAMRAISPGSGSARATSLRRAVSNSGHGGMMMSRTAPEFLACSNSRSISAIPIHSPYSALSGLCLTVSNHDRAKFWLRRQSPHKPKSPPTKFMAAGLHVIFG